MCSTSMSELFTFALCDVLSRRTCVGGNLVHKVDGRNGCKFSNVKNRVAFRSEASVTALDNRGEQNKECFPTRYFHGVQCSFNLTLVPFHVIFIVHPRRHAESLG